MQATVRFTIQNCMLIRLMRIGCIVFGVRSPAAKTAENTGMYWPIGVISTRITMPFMCIQTTQNTLSMETMAG